MWQMLRERETPRWLLHACRHRACPSLLPCDAGSIALLLTAKSTTCSIDVRWSKADKISPNDLAVFDDEVAPNQWSRRTHTLERIADRVPVSNRFPAYAEYTDDDRHRHLFQVSQDLYCCFHACLYAAIIWLRLSDGATAATAAPRATKAATNLGSGTWNCSEMGMTSVNPRSCSTVWLFPRAFVCAADVSEHPGADDFSSQGPIGAYKRHPRQLF